MVILNITVLVACRQLESEGVLDPSCDVDLYSLHLAFLPVIQKLLDEFVEYWNLHGLSSIPGRPSPVRLFEMGLFTLREKGEREGRTFTELIQVRPPTSPLFQGFSNN